MLITNNKSINKVLASIVFKTAWLYVSFLLRNKGLKLLFRLLHILIAIKLIYFLRCIDAGAFNKEPIYIHFEGFTNM